jgi:hypothetical protein
MTLQKQCFFPDKCNSIETLYRSSIGKKMTSAGDGACDDIQLYDDLAHLMKFKKKVKESERLLVRCSKLAKKSFGPRSPQYRQSLMNLKEFYDGNDQHKKAIRVERSVARLSE